MQMFKPQAVPNQPDITAALALRDQIVAFNATAKDRAELSEADRAAMERIRAGVEAFRAARMAIPQITRDRTGVIEQTREILSEVERYLSLTVGSQKTTVAGEEFETPALESPTARAHIRRVGDELAERITAYVDERQQELARWSKEVAEADHALATARKIPLLGPAIELFEQLYILMCANANVPAYRHAINDFPSLLRYLVNLPEASERLPKSVSADALVQTIIRQHEEREGRKVA